MRKWISHYWPSILWVAFIGAIFFLPVISSAYNYFHVTCEYQTIAHTTERVADDSMYVTDPDKVITIGTDGSRHVCKRGNGNVVSNVITTSASNGVVYYGTKIDTSPIYTPLVQQQLPPTTCNDGTYSWSTGRGTCSWHGGIAHYNY